MQSEKPYRWLSWFGTFCVLLSAFMASRNFFPYYAYSYVFANSVWMLIGYLWGETSLIVLGGGVNLIFISGLIFK